jgi:hypothetical protein
MKTFKIILAFLTIIMALPLFSAGLSFLKDWTFMEGLLMGFILLGLFIIILVVAGGVIAAVLYLKEKLLK